MYVHVNEINEIEVKWGHMNLGMMREEIEYFKKVAQNNQAHPTVRNF